MDARLNFPSVIIEGRRGSGKLTWLKTQLPTDMGPDLIEIFSEKTYKLEEFEEIFKVIPIRPLIKSFRAIIIRRAENVPPLIFNKLLKTLEETKFNRFYFLTTNRTVILPTIRSRSVLIRPPMKPQDVGAGFSSAPFDVRELVETLNKDGTEELLVELQQRLWQQKPEYADLILDIERTLQSNNPNIKLGCRYHLTSILVNLQREGKYVSSR